jgi:hypothetical protein
MRRVNFYWKNCQAWHQSPLHYLSTLPPTGKALQPQAAINSFHPELLASWFLLKMRVEFIRSLSNNNRSFCPLKKFYANQLFENGTKKPLEV